MSKCTVIGDILEIAFKSYFLDNQPEHFIMTRIASRLYYTDEDDKDYVMDYITAI